MLPPRVQIFNTLEAFVCCNSDRKVADVLVAWIVKRFFEENDAIVYLGFEAPFKQGFDAFLLLIPCVCVEVLELVA